MAADVCRIRVWLIGAGNLPVAHLNVPAAYDWLPPSELPSLVLELANFYRAIAGDRADDTHTAPSFADAACLQSLFDALGTSAGTGARVSVS